MSKLPFIGFIFFIVILQTFFLALCQNTFNGTFSIINQIESYLALRRLAKEISYQEMFLQKKLSVNLVKTLEKNLQQHGKVSSGLFPLLLKISRLISSQIKIWVFMKVMWPVKVSRTLKVVFCWFFLGNYSCCPIYYYLLMPWPNGLTIRSWPN